MFVVRRLGPFLVSLVVRVSSFSVSEVLLLVLRLGRAQEVEVWWGRRSVMKIVNTNRTPSENRFGLAVRR